MKGTVLMKRETINKTEKGYILVCLQFLLNIYNRCNKNANIYIKISLYCKLEVFKARLRKQFEVQKEHKGFEFLQIF